MDLAMRCLPIGALPYIDVRPVITMMTKLHPKMPFVAPMPIMSPNDTVSHWMFENIPGIIYEEGSIRLKIGDSKYEDDTASLDRAISNPNSEELETFGFHSQFLEKYLQIIKKFRTPYACVTLLGPLTIFNTLMEAAKVQVLADKSYRKVAVNAVCAKALWIIKKN